MSNFQLIPVMDLLNNKVVHAIRGERKNYKPLDKEFPSYPSNPLELIKKVILKFKITSFYVADLNLIQHNQDKSPNFGFLRKLSSLSEIDILIDLGIRKQKNLLPYVDLNFSKYILGLETLSTLDTLRTCLKQYSPEKIILSLDLYKGNLITNISDMKENSLQQNLKIFENLGVRNLILLDLYRVGSKEGGIPPLYLKILDQAEGEVFVGGGIKNIEDVVRYKKEGFSGVLVGTSLYDGTISGNDIERL
ncbi:MAG: HisA/HisF-related TIM barrel protein [Promethearchaeia archaeon]